MELSGQPATIPDIILTSERVEQEWTALVEHLRGEGSAEYMEAVYPPRQKTRGTGDTDETVRA